MKILHTTSLFFFYLFIFSANSQPPAILGIDCDGGSNGKGQLFTIDNTYNTVSTLQEFDYIEGEAQYNFEDLCLANNGKYYGLHSMSDRDRSVIFEYTVDSNSYRIVNEIDQLQMGVLLPAW